MSNFEREKGNQEEKIEQFQLQLQAAGLCAVQSRRDQNLIIGGSKITESEYGYEVEEPIFTIKRRGTERIAVIQDPQTLGEVDAVKRCFSLTEAVDFVCRIASQ